MSVRNKKKNKKKRKVEGMRGQAFKELTEFTITFLGAVNLVKSSSRSSSSLQSSGSVGQGKECCARKQ